MAPRQQELLRCPCVTGGELDFYLSYTGTLPDWTVVYVHGLNSSRVGEKPQAFEEACARRGWAFAALDFRGHGGSTGTLLELRATRLLEDLQSARTLLVARGVSRFCLVGSSMGGFASAWFTVRHPESVVACACIAPAFDFLRQRWLKLPPPEQENWKRTGRLRVQNRWIDVELGYGLVEEIDLFPVEELASRWCRPLLIYHGMEDDLVPYTESLALVQRSTYPDIELRLYRGGDHRLLAFKDEMAEAACQFFARWVGSDV